MIREAKVVLQSTVEEKIINELNSNSTEIAPKEYSTVDNLVQLLGLVLLLIIILIAAYYTSRLVGSVRLRQLNCSNFKVIDSYRISSNKLLQIVKIGSKYFVIAITKDTINLISELDEADIITNEVSDTRIKQLDKLNFKQILDKVKKK